MLKFFASLVGCSLAAFCLAAEKTPNDLRVGLAGHAFDHLGNIGEQADACADSGVNIIYATGLGSIGYTGLPPEESFSKQRKAAADYVHHAKSRGIRLAIGYVCATSIVKLDSFDKNWSQEFRAKFKTPPSEWRQRGRDGNFLPSWYGGDYQPACMNNPDWRTYEKFIVRQQLETGHDGIFFDNPTVSPQGCYCNFCMEGFAWFIGAGVFPPSTEKMREIAAEQPKDFLRFRATIARNFMADMRKYARTINPHALITCNNSLNSPDAFYSQSRNYGYDIYEMTKAEDFVVVEDMGNQPRVVSGNVIEYGPTYKLLHAINHEKPVVAVTIADGDYHTAPNLVRLAMAEAAANSSSYLSWPTWPENVRAKMSSSIRPQADFLLRHEKLLNETKPRSDVLLFLPFQRWVEGDQCTPLTLATALTRANIQYEVICEDDFAAAIKSSAKAKTPPVLLLESKTVLNETEKEALKKFKGPIVTADKPDWLNTVTTNLTRRSVSLKAPSTVRVVVSDQGKRTIVHLLNLNVQKLSSFEDKVNLAENVELSVFVPTKNVRSVRLITADVGGSSGDLSFLTEKGMVGTFVKTTVPKLSISGILVIE